MASVSGRSSSSRSSTSLMPGRILIALDGTKNHSREDFLNIIASIREHGGMIQEVDTITVLGVLHKVFHPMGFEMEIGSESFIGARVRAIKELVAGMVETYVKMLRQTAEECDSNGVTVEVKIIVGNPLKKVVVHEAVTSNATWVVLNRHLKKEVMFYLKYIPCKVALVLDQFALEILRPYYCDKAKASVEYKLFYSLSKLVPALPAEYSNDSALQSVISPNCHESMSSLESPYTGMSSSTLVTPKSMPSPDESSPKSSLEKSGTNGEVKMKSTSDNSPQIMQKQCQQYYSDVHTHCNATEMKSNTELTESIYYDVQIASATFSSDTQIMHNAPSCESDETPLGANMMQCSYSEVQAATSDFSTDNLLGEGVYGGVYKGQLENGQQIVVKVLKGENAQGSEFVSELCVLSMARHKNIVMLLGRCLKESRSILIYEYVCNKSLNWHLFDNTESTLEWHRRHAIAIGIAKGLRFLHEECRGRPIIHRDLRPSNILITHDYVPLLGDFGLAKWRKQDNDRHAMTLEYLAPEYVENGTCSVKTDVYAFGIVLIQLISGRKVVNPTTNNDSSNNNKCLKQWAFPLINRLRVDDLVDPRLGDSYSIYELYKMARLAYSCVRSKPASRPTMGEVVQVLEGMHDDHLRRMSEQYIPHFRSARRVAVEANLFQVHEVNSKINTQVAG